MTMTMTMTVMFLRLPLSQIQTDQIKEHPKHLLLLHHLLFVKHTFEKADEHEVITNIYEYYADYFAINHDLFTLNITNSLLNSLPRSRWDANQQTSFSRQVQGCMSALLSLKWKPIIRYQGSSELAQQFSRTLQQQIVTENKLFTFGSRSSNQPILLVLDRRDDPVTPLLTQWTYQAMVHELVGLTHNRVNLENAKGIKKDMREVVLSCVEDEFFNLHMYDNFGDLGKKKCLKKRLRKRTRK